uniref:Ubiquinol oxidase n=1 Tax=Populus pruinosa TaxID=492479 RepID=A0A1Q1PR82_9ROSI|nr:alternative oxidase [Populus pruinosa]
MLMASREGASKLVSSMMLVSRSFSTATARGILAKEAVPAKAVGFNGDVVRRNIGEFWVRGSVFGLRHGSTASYSGKDQQQEEVKHSQPVAEGGDKAEEKNAIVSYWGVPPSRVTKEDGTEWKWNCFRIDLVLTVCYLKLKPWETYSADLSINLTKHHAPVTFLDKMAYWTVKSLRWPTDLFFQRRYGCRAMMLETVAAVPGMVGGMLLHCKSLRRFEHSGGWIKALLEEAENERMHLMTFMEVANPKWYERALVITVQGVFFNAYFLGYLISPKFAHRMVGYLEEEAIHSYTEFLKELDKGNIKNVPAPAIAIDYWRLPPNSTLRDVVEVVRADEAHHRDVNHFASDIHYQGRELKEAPAPIGYH